MRRSAFLSVAAGLTMAATASPALAESGTGAGTGWRQFDVPVEGETNVLTVAATGRHDAWAGGLVLRERSKSKQDLAARRSLAGRGDGSPESSAMPGWSGMPGPSRGTAPRATARAADECVDRRTFYTLMLHWNGKAWTKVTMPEVGRVNHISALRADDVWASADCALLHWDGRTWKSVPYEPIPNAQQVGNWSIKAVGPRDAWLLVYTYDNTTGFMRSYVQRWDGERWRDVRLPDLGDEFMLDSIDARGPNDAWAVGTAYSPDDSEPEKTLLLHWDGRSWQRTPEPSTGEWTNRLTRVRMVSRNDVWVSGWGKRKPDWDQIRRPLLLHWDGRKWSAAKVPDGRGELMDVAVSGRRAFAAGDDFAPAEATYSTYALRLTGQGWEQTAPPVSGTGTIEGLAPIPGGGMWSVGTIHDADDRMRPVIARQG
ncbi:hypothetical protein [Actinomadura gamaensis]|uniref:Secreted protein n=1 Tax=Actinomadura gamaensis TaxID=1763541 RepID=A0ABV9U216_9ACTN